MCIRDSVGRDRIRKVLRDNGLLGIQGRNHKYHSYTGDNGMDKRNLLLAKEVDEKIIKRHINVILKQQVQMKNGQQMYRNLNYLQGNFTCHQF